MGSGKLTKVQSPSGDVEHLLLSYDSNFITKVELKKDATVLVTYQYAYTNNELTKVTDNASHDVSYEYDSNGRAEGSRYVTTITDKVGVETTFAWVFSQNEASEWEASKITMTNPQSITGAYERSVSTSVCTSETKNGQTLLGKWVYTPRDNEVRAGENSHCRHT